MKPLIDPHHTHFAYGSKSTASYDFRPHLLHAHFSLIHSTYTFQY